MRVGVGRESKCDAQLEMIEKNMPGDQGGFCGEEINLWRQMSKRKACEEDRCRRRGPARRGGARIILLLISASDCREG